MKHSASLTSKIILSYLFTTSELLHPESLNEKQSLSAICDDLEDYKVWAQKRIEILFRECCDYNWSKAEKIKRIDKTLVTIFPFLKRLVDRSLIIEKTLYYLELYEREDEEEPVSAAPIVEEPVSAAPIVEEPVSAAPIVEVTLAAKPKKIRPKSKDTKADTILPETDKKIPLNQSLGTLRKILNELGVRNAFLLSKKEATNKISLYNAGKLSETELKR